MLKIGEFSKLTQISVRMLRHYDECGLLHPSQVDRFTGYRLYSVDQIPTLNRIIFLRDTGFNLSEIAAALAHWDNASIQDLLQNKQKDIEGGIRAQQDKLKKIQMAIGDIPQEKIAMDCNIAIKCIPSYQVLSLRKVLPSYFDEGWLWKEMAAFTEKHQILVPQDRAGFAIYHDQDYRDRNVDVEICTVVDNIGADKDGFTYRNTEKVPTMACTMVYGAYENISGAYLRFAQWLQQHNQYQMMEQSRQICHRGPWNEQNPSLYLTEIQIAVEKNNG